MHSGYEQAGAHSLVYGQGMIASCGKFMTDVSTDTSSITIWTYCTVELW